jgi:tRNA(Arg) A34 adenosine deaminase TadA
MFHFSHSYMDSCPFANFWRLDPDTILGRDALDDFLPGNLGPNPVVDLRGPAQTHLHRIYLALAFRRVRRKLETYEKGLAIAAVLVNAVDGRIRAIAHNTKNLNETFHAEVNLTQAFYKAHAAERQGAFLLYSTLQPCPMCAAMVAEMLPNAVVYFGQNDNGGHMARMALQPRVMVALAPGLTQEEELDDEMSQVHHIKPLRVFKNSGESAYDDVVGRMDSIHANLKLQGHTSLTRNLYDPNSKETIRGASSTIQRKAQQYLHGGKATVVPDYARTQRRQGIQRLMQHLAPIL